MGVAVDIYTFDKCLMKCTDSQVDEKFAERLCGCPGTSGGGGQQPGRGAGFLPPTPLEAY